MDLELLTTSNSNVGLPTRIDLEVLATSNSNVQFECWPSNSNWLRSSTWIQLELECPTRMLAFQLVFSPEGCFPSVGAPSSPVPSDFYVAICRL